MLLDVNEISIRQLTTLDLHI